MDLNMEVFLKFLNSKEHFYYVISSYCVVFLLLGLIFFQTSYKVKKLQKKLNRKLNK
ncbi:MAG: hypothetical protein CMI74_00535 [Candidatus Pelagibacter sp.]|nr:hypothetical protein [Candidatus Pelagibacter sp.]